MRTKHIALFAAASLLSLSSIAAEPATVNVEARAAQVKKVYIDPLVYKNVQGAYKLDDGRTLKITGQSRKLYADFGDGVTEIVHVGNDRFEAVGKNVGVHFDDSRYPRAVFVNSAPQHQVASTGR